MKTVTGIFFILFFIPVLCLADSPPVPRQISGDVSTLGVQSLDLKEIWRAGGEDEDIIFGRIVDVKTGPDGNMYVLDNQLCQVVVISPEGEHLRNLSREGDGPGELRQPVALAFISENILGIGMGYPGKMISLQLDGTPAESFYPIGVPSEGNIGLLMGVQYLDGVLVACGGRMVFGDNGQGHVDRFLSVCNLDCTETQRILEKATPLDLTGQKFVEATDYYIETSWALGAGKLIYAAMERDVYEISVFDTNGKQLKTFGRKYQPRKRTSAEKQAIRPIINVNNNSDMEVIAEDYDECITRILFNHDQETLWVLTAHGNNEKSEEILETWDVFTVDGEFLKQVIIPLGAEMNEGNIYLVGGNKLVVVKGDNSVFNAEENPAEENSEQVVEPLEVICYEMR